MAFILIAGLALVGAWGQEPDGGAPPATEPEAELPKKKIPLVIPNAAKTRPNPVEASEEAIAHGMQVYSHQCVMCHGVSGNGKGDVAVQFGIDVPDLTEPATLKKRTDGALFYILTEGHGSMPASGERMSEDLRWEIVHAVRSMAE